MGEMSEVASTVTWILIAAGAVVLGVIIGARFAGVLATLVVASVALVVLLTVALIAWVQNLAISIKRLVVRLWPGKRKDLPNV